MPSPPHQQSSNSLLNLLNPYSSVAQSTYPRDNNNNNNAVEDESSNLLQDKPPDSPSAVLLRELQVHPEARQPRSPPMSPTPKPRPVHVIATPTDSSSEDEGPPQSLMFGDHRRGDKTPRSNTSDVQRGSAGLGVPNWNAAKKAHSPGPFRRQPTSSSSSAHSPQSSPGPSRQHSVDDSLASAPSTESTSSPPISSGAFEYPRQPARRSSPPRETRGKQLQLNPPVTHDDGDAESSPSTPGPSRVRTKGRGRNRYQSVPTNEFRSERHKEPSVRKAGLTDYNKALWKWANVVDMDSFLQEVYAYYKGKGFWCIAIARTLNLLTTFFVLAFSTFLMSCVDYSKLSRAISGSKPSHLDELLVGQCVTRPSFTNVLLIVIMSTLFIFQLATFVLSMPGLIDMWRFYTYLLHIPDGDIQTLPWPEIVRLIGDIRKENPVTSLSNGQATALADMVGGGRTRTNAVLDAHDIANRILRQENYLIALFNKDLLDLRVRIPLPSALIRFVPPSMLTGAPHGGLPKSQGDDKQEYLTFGGNSLSTALEWNLRFCLMGYLFDRNGQVRKEVVRDKGRRDLVEELRRRFIFMGVLNAVFAPFIVIYLLIYSFFRYFAEYHKNPSSIGTRQYTPYAQWKFREFNELPHLFERRLDQSYPIAKEYIDQFPKERAALIMRFVAFVAGSFVAVLLAASLLDPDLLVTPHRTVVFYLTVFTAVLAVSRGMIPEENFVFDPEYLMREVVRYTHYLPKEWEDKLHSQQVHAEFGQLFQLKVTVFVQELFSVLLTPLILWFSLPGCSGAIIDFFREFTVHVEGIGYVCSFAVFDFQRHGNLGPERAATQAGVIPLDNLVMQRRANPTRPPPPPIPPPQPSRRMPAARDAYLTSENKMEQSFLHFKATHPDWQPTDPNASVMLDRLVGQYGPSTAAGRAPRHHNGLSSSLYTGGRGLGLGLHMGGTASASKDHSGVLQSPGIDESLHNGSRWHGAQGSPTHRVAEIPHLQPMPEGDDRETDEDDEAEAMGWNRRLDDVAEDGEDEPSDRGLLRDAGIILQKVMNR